MRFYYKTDIGCKRSENQDRVTADSLLEPNTAMFAVICDGMGGERAGGCAAEIACDVVASRVRENFRAGITRNQIRNLLVTSVTAANSKVINEAQSDINKKGMGTTCVAAIIYDERAYIINVGDSRAYHMWDGSIQQITNDHTQVRKLIELGKITEAEAKVHPDRNCITRAVGAELTIFPDYFELDLTNDSRILLCSDGLHVYADDERFLELGYGRGIEEWCDELMGYALRCGGKDNISVAVLEC